MRRGGDAADFVDLDGHDVLAWDHGQAQYPGLVTGHLFVGLREALRARSQNDVGVLVGAEEDAYEDAAVAEHDAHVAVQPAAEEGSGRGGLWTGCGFFHCCGINLACPSGPAWQLERLRRR